MEDMICSAKLSSDEAEQKKDEVGEKDNQKVTFSRSDPTTEVDEERKTLRGDGVDGWVEIENEIKVLSDLIESSCKRNRKRGTAANLRLSARRITELREKIRGCKTESGDRNGDDCASLKLEADLKRPDQVVSSGGLETDGIKMKLEKGVDDACLPELLLEEWPPESFQHTRERRGNVFQEKTADLVLVVDVSESSEFIEKLSERIQLGNLIKDGVPEAGEIVIVRENGQVVRITDNSSEQKRGVYVVSVNSKQSGVDLVNCVIEGVEKASNMRVGKSVAYGCTSRLSDYVKKLVEYKKRRELKIRKSFKVSIYVEKVQAKRSVRCKKKNTENEKEGVFGNTEKRTRSQASVSRVEDSLDEADEDCSDYSKEDGFDWASDSSFGDREMEESDSEKGTKKDATEKVPREKNRVRDRRLCDICGGRFSSSYFTKHLATHAGGILVECSVCKKKYVHTYLKTHMKMHTGEKSFACEICGKQFARSDVFKVHQQMHRGDKRHHCKVCDKRFVNPATLRVHMRVHTGFVPYSCRICEKKFRLRTMLKVHMRRHGSAENSESQTVPESETNKDPFFCEVCKKEFTQPGYLKIHMRIHTGERPFCCPVCEKRFSQSGSLKQHMRLHTGESFDCPICKRQFHQQSNLKAHVRTHSDDNPFGCKVCGKQFVGPCKLKQHMRTHTGEKPYACDICKRQFAVMGNLKVHMRTHTGEKPHACKFCESRFSDSKGLKKHLQTHSGEAEKPTVMYFNL